MKLFLFTIDYDPTEATDIRRISVFTWNRLVQVFVNDRPYYGIGLRVFSIYFLAGVLRPRWGR